MADYQTGGIYEDEHGETFLRVADLSPDPKPWRFIDVSAGVMEPRAEGFPHGRLRLRLVIEPAWEHGGDGDG